MQSFHGAHLPPRFYRVSNLFVERRPVIEGSNLQEFDERVELLDTVLPAILKISMV